MNCQDFRDRLHEYLDETMADDLHGAAREHLRQCDDCRRALLREEAFAKSIRRSLERATSGFSLRSETQRNILKALESKSVPSNTWMHVWQKFISISLHPIGAGTAVLVVLLLILGIQIHRRAAEDSVPQAIVQIGQNTCVIDVPIRTQTHIFRRQNNTVVDTIAPGMTIGHARFPESTNPKP